MKRSINTQIPSILAGCTTNGAGGLTVPVRQRGTIDDSGDSGGGWTIVDGAAGRLQLTLGAAVQLQELYIQVRAQLGAAGTVCRAFMVDTETIEVVVLSAADGTTAVNLATTVVAIQLTADQV